MRQWSISGRSVNRISMAAIGISAALVVGVSIASGAFSSGDDEITACVRGNGSVRIVDSGRCKNGERPVSWARRGQAGPAGPPGPQGRPGETQPADSAPPCPQAQPPVESSLALFAQVAGIPGDSRDIRHRDQIDLTGLSFDATAASGGCRPGGAARRLGDLVIAKQLDRATPPLLEALADGRTIPTVRIEGVAAGGGPTATVVYELTNVGVSAFSTATRGGIPVEVVSLRYGSLTLTQRSPDPRGGLGPATTVTITRP